MKKILLFLLGYAGLITQCWAVTYTMASGSRPPCSTSWSVSGSTYTCSGTITLNGGDSIAPASTSTITGNVSNNGGAIGLSNVTLNGSIAATSGGVMNLTMSSSTVNGNVSHSANGLTVNGGTINGNLSAGGSGISLTNVNVTGNISSPSNTITITGGTINGNISSGGGSGVVISNATMTGGSITANNVPINISNSTIGSSSSSVNVSGNNTVTISNGSNVYGNVTSGSWSSAMNIDSTSTIYGVCASNSNSVASPAQYPRCLNLTPLADWRMDEFSWNGTSGEVKDSSGGGRHGTAAFANGSGPRPTTASSNRAYVSGTQSTCSYGVFDSTSSPVRTYSYIGLPSTPTLPSAFTFTAWIRSTNVGASGQRILVNDDAQNGWGFSLGDGGSGTLRLFNRNIDNSGSVSGGVDGNCGVFCLDTNSVINNNVWYFVAVAVDTANKTVRLYVINTSGTILAQASSAFSGTWANGSGIWAIGGESAASGEGTQSGFHFNGNIDEVGVYSGMLSTTALQTLRTRVRSCQNTQVNHYELRVPASSVTCVQNQVTVAACADSAVPCSSYVNTIGGQTAVLGTSAGTLASTTVTFDGAGLATTTLSNPSAADNSTAILTLTNETAPAQTARVCCVGASCSVANTCTTTFNTAGFVVSTAANEIATNISSQIAGSGSGYYLRAVRTNTSTKACEAALQGTRTVDFAYECDGNPSNCASTDRMTVAGSAAAQAIKGNNNNNVVNYQPISLNFDADGNAPFTMNYLDVGQLRLWVRKVPGADTPGLLTTLSMTSNAFIVKPYDFGFGAISCGSTANPAAADATGAKFCAAGSPFTAVVNARALGGSLTPGFGRCDSGITGAACALETVVLTHTLVAPVGGVSGTLGGTSTANVTAFTNGSYTFGASGNFNWNEVGIINLKASNSNYLFNELAVCSTQLPGEACRGTYGSSGNVGRFYPGYFKVDLIPPKDCTGFIYGGHTESGPTVLLGQPMTVAVTAKSGTGANDITQNYKYDSVVANSYAKNINLTLTAGGGTTGDLYVDSVKGGSNAIPASKFVVPIPNPPDLPNPLPAPGLGMVKYSDTSGKISYVFGLAMARPIAPTVVTVHADDADYPVASPSPGTGNATIQARFGRLRLSNAFGSEKQNLRMPIAAQYWSGNTWVPNSADSCTSLAPNSFFFLPLGAATTTVSGTTTLTNGNGNVVLTATAPNTGSVDIAANLGTSGSDQSCLASHGGSSASQPWLRSRNGNCAATFDRDPSARATFGIYSPEALRVIHVRELF